MTALSMDDLHRRVLALEERARAEDEAASAREESRPAHSSSNPYREMLMPTRKPTTSQITSPTKATQQAECSVDERLRRFLQESAALVSHALTLQTSVVRERLQQPGTQETGEALPQPPPETGDPFE